MEITGVPQRCLLAPFFMQMVFRNIYRCSLHVYLLRLPSEQFLRSFAKLQQFLDEQLHVYLYEHISTNALLYRYGTSINFNIPYGVGLVAGARCRSRCNHGLFYQSLTILHRKYSQ